MTRPLQPLTRWFPRPVVNRVKHQVGRTIAWNLDALAVLWDTDKGPRHHRYTAEYARHLRLRRRSIQSVLEIGVGGYGNLRSGGQSLYMWRNYFPRATVYGLDVHRKQLESNVRVATIEVDQSDRASLERALVACPVFDLIVDDGSHVGAHVITSFEFLFPRLRPGGIYAIEDVYYAYDPRYGGGPPGSDGTALALAKDLLDAVNREPKRVAALHAYPGLVLIEKSRAQPMPAGA